MVFKSGRFEGKNWIHHPAPRHHQTLTDRSQTFRNRLHSRSRCSFESERKCGATWMDVPSPHLAHISPRSYSADPPHTVMPRCRQAAVQQSSALSRLCPAAALAGPRRGPFSGKNAGRARTRARHLDGGGPSRRRSGSGDGRAAESVPICAAARAGLLLQR